MAGTTRNEPTVWKAIVRADDGTALHGKVATSYLRLQLLYKHQPDGFVELAREIYLQLCRDDGLI